MKPKLQRAAGNGSNKAKATQPTKATDSQSAASQLSPEQIKDKVESDRPRTLPDLCEKELQEVCGKYGPEKRREIADRLERWIAQLRTSADLIERADIQLDSDPEIVLPDAELADLLFNRKYSECVALAAKWESWCHTTREVLGIKSARAAAPAVILSRN